MKIAIFHNLPPGGARKSLFKITENLSLNNQIDCYTLDLFNDSFFTLDKLVEKKFTYKINKKINLYKLLNELSFCQKKIAKEIDSKKYDLVFVNPCIVTQAPYLLQYLETPSFYFCQEPNREFYEQTTFQTQKIAKFIKMNLIKLYRYPIKHIDFLNTRKAKYIITNSKYTSEQINRIYNRNSKPIYLGVDSFKYKPTQKNKKYLISIGSYTFLKGHHWVIQTLNHYYPDMTTTLLIAGYEGNQEKQIKQIANNKQIKIKFVKKAKNAELINYLNESYLYLNGAYKEPFGLSLLESMACKTPVISVNEGGPSEIIDHKINGYLIERSEPLKFAKTVRKLLKNKKQIENLGIKARNKVINKFTWLKTTNKIEKFFKSNL